MTAILKQVQHYQHKQFVQWTLGYVTEPNPEGALNQIHALDQSHEPMQLHGDS